MSLNAIATPTEKQLVREILEAAGARGASHEDFVEAGLARDYIGTLRQLVDADGVEIRTDFTTGQARWALVTTDRMRALRAA
jgi:hypothetical protein